MIGDAASAGPTPRRRERRGSVIVVGYSAKPEGRAALQRAVAEAQLRSARLIVVHTSPDAEVDELDGELAPPGSRTRCGRRADALDPAEELINAAERPTRSSS